MPSSTPRLNEALRLLRVFHDMSRSEVQDLISISPSYLSEIENGQRRVTLNILEKYSAGFDIPLSSLMLFGEQLDSPSPSEKFRAALTDRVLAVLQWIEAREKHSTA